jgi:hypothetical protein
MAVRLNDEEKAVLKAFVALDAEDNGGAWAAYYAPIVTAAGGGLPTAQAICANLRRRKLLKGEGRGLHAAFYPTEKGKEAVADA